MGCDIEDQKYMVLFIIWMSYTFVCVAAVILLIKAASGRKTKPILIVSMLAFCWASMGVPLLLQDMLNLQINLSCGNKTQDEKEKQQQDMFPNYNIWVAYFIANLCLSWFLLPMTQEFHVSPERNMRHKFRKILAKRFKVLLLWMCLLTIPEFIIKYLQSKTEVQSNNHDDMVVPMVIISMIQNCVLISNLSTGVAHGIRDVFQGRTLQKQKKMLFRKLVNLDYRKKDLFQQLCQAYALLKEYARLFQYDSGTSEEQKLVLRSLRDVIPLDATLDAEISLSRSEFEPRMVIRMKSYQQYQEQLATLKNSHQSRRRCLTADDLHSQKANLQELSGWYKCQKVLCMRALVSTVYIEEVTATIEQGHDILMSQFGNYFQQPLIFRMFPEFEIQWYKKFYRSAKLLQFAGCIIGTLFLFYMEIPLPLIHLIQGGSQNTHNHDGDHDHDGSVTAIRVGEWHLHILMTGLWSSTLLVLLTYVYSAVILRISWSGLHHNDIFSTQLLKGHSSAISIAQFSKMVCILIPALLFSLINMGIEDCSSDHLDYQVVVGCQLFRYSRTSNSGDPSFTIDMLKSYTSLGNFVVFGLASILSWYLPAFSGLMQQLRRLLVVWKPFKGMAVPKELFEQDSLYAHKQSQFQVLDNRYFGLDESRVDEANSQMYEGPHDEIYSRADQISSLKADSADLPMNRESLLHLHKQKSLLTQAMTSPIQDLGLDYSLVTGRHLSTMDSRATWCEFPDPYITFNTDNYSD